MRMSDLSSDVCSSDLTREQALMVFGGDADAGVAHGNAHASMGVVWAAMTTTRRGRLSDPEPAPTKSADTLEPAGRGRRLSLSAELPAFALIIVGAVILFAGAFV